MKNLKLTTTTYQFRQELGGDYEGCDGFAITVNDVVVGGFALDDWDSDVAGKTKLDKIEILPEFRMKGYGKATIRAIFLARPDIQHLYGQGVKGSEKFWQSVGALHNKGSRLDIYRGEFMKGGE